MPFRSCQIVLTDIPTEFQNTVRTFCQQMMPLVKTQNPKAKSFVVLHHSGTTSVGRAFEEGYVPEYYDPINQTNIISNVQALVETHLRMITQLMEYIKNVLNRKAMISYIIHCDGTRIMICQNRIGNKSYPKSLLFTPLTM